MNTFFDVLSIDVLVVSAFLELFTIGGYEVRCYFLKVIVLYAVWVHGMKDVYNGLEEPFYLVNTVLEVWFIRGLAEHDMCQDVAHKLHVHILILIRIVSDFLLKFADVINYSTHDLLGAFKVFILDSSYHERNCSFAFHSDIASSKEHNFIHNHSEVILGEIFGSEEVVTELDTVLIEVGEIVQVCVLVELFEVILEHNINLADQFKHRFDHIVLNILANSGV